jgi:hypothetical protein
MTGDALGELPRNLQSLRMSETKVSDEHLKMLPPTLKTFASLQTGITDDGIKNLPKGMETLGLLGDHGDAAIKNAPPNLKRLLIGSGKGTVTDEGMKDLPKTLQQLDILSHQVTGSAIQYIPKSVHTLGLPLTLENMHGLKDISENVHTLTISADLNDATITDIPRTVRNVHLIGDVPPDRLQQLNNARGGTRITAETVNNYSAKFDPAFRGEGDLAFK